MRNKSQNKTNTSTNKIKILKRNGKIRVMII